MTARSAAGHHQPAGSEIRFRHVSRIYPGNTVAAVNDVSLDIAPGNLVVLLGTSGSGKTTLLKMVNRLIEPTSGSILIDGQDVQSLPAPALRRQIGYVIQQAGLFPHMRVRDNIAVVPRLLKWDRARIAHRVNELLDLVGLPADTFASRYPAQLSGGEQQRIGLARALAAEPGTLLMDEPFGALDAITRRRLQDELRRIHTTLNSTILFVTHDVDEALRLADRIVIMREGRVEQEGAPLDIIEHPANDFVADLVGANDAIRRMRLIPVEAAIVPAASSFTSTDLPCIQAGESLREALNVLVVGDASSLLVEDAAGKTLGMVTLESLRETASGDATTTIADLTAG